MPSQNESKPPDSAQPANVVSLFGRPPAHREPPPTLEEIAEYRRMRPALLKMLAEWEELTGPNGCPVAHSIIHGMK